MTPLPSDAQPFSATAEDAPQQSARPRRVVAAALLFLSLAALGGCSGCSGGGGGSGSSGLCKATVLKF